MIIQSFAENQPMIIQSFAEFMGIRWKSIMKTEIKYTLK